MSGKARGRPSRRKLRDELLQKVVEEARQSSRFRDRVLEEMERLAAEKEKGKGKGKGEKTPARRTGRRDPGVLDPFAVHREEGEEALRDALADLELKELKDIVAEHGMDQARLAMKWKSPERLVDLIATTVRARLSKGRAFGPE